MYKFKVRKGYNLDNLIIHYGFYEQSFQCLMYKQHPEEKGLAIAVNPETREALIVYRTRGEMAFDQKEPVNAVFAKLIKEGIIIIEMEVD